MVSKTNRSRLSMVLAVALGLMVAASPVVAGGSSLVVQSSTTSGCTVVVAVKNTSMTPKTGTVRVQATVNGMTVVGVAPVATLGGQTVNVSVGFSGSPTNASVSLSDDSVPY